MRRFRLALIGLVALLVLFAQNSWRDHVLDWVQKVKLLITSSKDTMPVLILGLSIGVILFGSFIWIFRDRSKKKKSRSEEQRKKLIRDIMRMPSISSMKTIVRPKARVDGALKKRPR